MKNRFNLHWWDSCGVEHDKYYSTKEEAMNKYKTFNASNCQKGYIEELKEDLSPSYYDGNYQENPLKHAPEYTKSVANTFNNQTIFGTPMTSTNILDF